MMNSGFLDFAVNIPKLEHFEGVGFYRWQKKMKFLFAALNVAYVLSTPKSVEKENETLEATLMEQFHEIVIILGQIRHHGMNIDDSIAIASIIDKLPPSWNKVHRALMQRKEELTMEQLGSHLYVEEGIRQKESQKKKRWEFKKNGKGKGKAWVKCWVCNGPHFKKDCEVWKEKMQGISSGDHGQGSGQWKQGKIINLVSDSTENFIAMISEVYVMQTDDSWWVDTGATRHVCKDMNLYKSYKNLEDGPSLYMGNDSMVKQFEEAPPLKPSLPIIPIQGAEEFHFQNTPIADDAIQDPSSPMAGQIREVSPINDIQQSEFSGGMAPSQNTCDDQSSTHTTTDSGQTPPIIPPRRSTRPRQVPNKLYDYYCGTLAQGRTSPHALSKPATPLSVVAIHFFTDVGFDSRTGKAFYGAIVLTLAGSFVATTNGPLMRCTDPKIAETLACKEALSWLKDRGVPSVRLLVDCFALSHK
nr:zinc finger, CCHC-type [Ipomoea batatas]